MTQAILADTSSVRGPENDVGLSRALDRITRLRAIPGNRVEYLSNSHPTAEPLRRQSTERPEYRDQGEGTNAGELLVHPFSLEAD